ncbi:hypothetical protein [Riemerella anatipestifer]|uniref:hypothetical protein n=1 Tax=Riemerella anatipestifer TaxID=34085 RepID=UPI0021B10762|nr:hypothetical protein [Riemerella anatipestifer]MCT6765634.1 hypothetical protein [Riemerella anatipestifer]MCT6769813.1 hypothetical protein [Riemerella anatipestifer]MDR7672813.1 hypothetical protein [Riemerella anatipestifer]MDR7692806.1 hypothetical protein [Riemerella anatipestifer]MDR7707110.1 hypothetical protein [Riemerella anatipestifer]
MKGYKFLISFDIQTQEGESVFRENLVNTCYYDEITDVELRAFNYQKTLDIVSRLVAHLVIVGFEGVRQHQVDRGFYQRVQPYNYELYFPIESPAPLHYHSSIKVNNSIPFGRLPIPPNKPNLKEEYQ